MKKIISGAILTLGLFCIPAFGLAATYQYVDVYGQVKSVEASSPEEALAKPTDIAARSGVMLLRQLTQEIL